MCAKAAGFSEKTILLALLPLGHNYNLACPGFLGALQAGGTLVIAESTDGADVFRAIAAERVTVIAACLPLITTWLNQGIDRSCDTSSLEVIQNGGARLAPELRARVRRELGCTPQEIYEYPGTRFVADFIGSVNMFEGQVIEDEPDYTLIRSTEAGGNLYVSHGISCAPGAAAAVAAATARRDF